MALEFISRHRLSLQWECPELTPETKEPSTAHTNGTALPKLSLYGSSFYAGRDGGMERRKGINGYYRVQSGYQAMIS